jgi:dTDP-4-dehydrorhamnose reductase
MKKILLLGNTGQLGWELNRSLLALGDLIALDYPQINMADPDNICSVIHQYQPALVINATAYTDVDKAEKNPELAMAINGTGPGILGEEVKRIGGALIHYSTDYVFDGTKGKPYNEEDEPNPINVYGETKLAGERAVQDVGGAYLIFRTSWVYSLRRPCFVTKVLQWARERETLRIVDDQISTPTWARTLAETTAQIIAKSQGNPVNYINNNSGLYHLSEAGFCSRFEWAKMIVELDPRKENRIVKEIVPAKSTDFLSPAKRPYFSVLDKQNFINRFHLIPPHWSKQVMPLSLNQT